MAEQVIPDGALLPVTLAVAGSLWTVELLRRRSDGVNARVTGWLAFILHPSERKEVVSGTWYITSLAVLAAIGQLELIAVALMVVGFGDPAAGAVGRRWGHTRIWGHRTAQGSAAYVLAGALAAGPALWMWHPDASLGMALAGAVAGATAELFSGGVDDNLTGPLAAAGGAAIWRALASSSTPIALASSIVGAVA
jgi:dolichol kinase